MEKRDDGTFELGPAAGVDGSGREGLPYDRLADVGSDEEGDARPESISILEELIEEDDDESSGNKLKN